MQLKSDNSINNKKNLYRALECTMLGSPRPLNRGPLAQSFPRVTLREVGESRAKPFKQGSLPGVLRGQAASATPMHLPDVRQGQGGKEESGEQICS